MWQQQLAAQRADTQWTTHLGAFTPAVSEAQFEGTRRGGMCPRGLALAHPAAGLLSKWATLGCPAQMGQDWIKAQMAVTILRGPHESAMMPEAWEHFNQEVAGRGKGGFGAGQAGGLGIHQAQPTSPVKNITNRCNPTQLEGILLHSQSVLSVASG